MTGEAVLKAAIIEAMGTHKKFSTEAKQSFAQAIVGDAVISIALGKELAAQVENHKMLRRRLKAAKKSMQILFSEIPGSLDGREVDILTTAALFKRYKVEIGGRMFQEYITTYEHILASQRPAKRKPGKNTSSALAVATLIAVQYRQHFGTFPIVAKPVKFDVRTTPYSRVCESVGKVLSLPISWRTQQEAVNKLKC